MISQSNSHILSSFKSFSRISCITVIIIGCLVLAGWIFNMAILKGLIPSLPKMMPNTAIAFILSGVSLLLLQSSPLSLSSPAEGEVKWKGGTARICITIVLLLGILTLSEYIYGINLRIDQLIFKDTETPEIFYPGRMSPYSSLIFILIGISLLLMNFKITRFFHAQLIAISSFILTLSSIIGYLYNVTPLYSISFHIGMSLPSAIGFLLISAGIIFTHPDKGLIAVISSNNAGGFFIRTFLPLAIVIPAAIGLLILEGQRIGFVGIGSAMYAFTITASITAIFLILWFSRKLDIIDTNHRQINEENRLLKTIALSLPEAEDLHSAIRIIINEICNATEWVHGESWTPDKDGKALEYCEGCSPYENHTEFTKYSKRFSFKPWQGLPGRVWASKKPEWVKDVSVDGEVFVRYEYAKKEHLAAAVGVPIIVSDEVLAVLIFYMHQVTQKDEYQLNLIMAVVAQLAPIIKGKQLKEALIKNEHKYRTLIENLPQRIFIKDHNSVYLSCNENYAIDLKITSDEIAGKTDYDFFPVELAEKYREEDIRIMELGLIAEIEEKYTINGKEAFVHTIKSPVKDENGNISGILGIFWDITEKMRIEAENKKLESQVLHMQKMEEIGRLTAGIAHDFNNLLTAIMLSANLLKRKIENNTELMFFIQQILNTVDRAANLTKSLLAFSRKQVIDKKPVSLNTIITDTEKFASRLIGENTNIKIKLPENDITLIADAGQIEQVLINLATNAKDAMPDGGVLTISAELANLNDEFIKSHGFGREGTYALINVSDTGTGMDVATKEKIFEPFFTTKGVGKGTGLGLSIVYGIVKQHDGYITADSEYGKGTILRIYLPAVKTAVDG